MGKKKLTERIADALGLYETEEAEEMVETEAEENTAAITPVEKPNRFAAARREQEKKEAEEKKEKSKSSGKGLLSKMKRSKSSDNTIQMTARQEVKVVVLEPTSFDDSQKAADYLKNGQAVVVNFENTDQKTRNRMTDFLSGTIYALKGTIRKITNDILVCAPHNVDIDAESELYGGRR